MSASKGHGVPGLTSSGHTHQDQALDLWTGWEHWPLLISSGQSSANIDATQSLQPRLYRAFIFA